MFKKQFSEVEDACLAQAMVDTVREPLIVVGAAAAFLASSDSGFMTASEVAVDGGLAQL